MAEVVLILLTILLCLLSYIAYYSWKMNQYWKERGIPYVKPDLFFGNMYRMLFKNMSPGELQQSMCKELPDEPYFGYMDMVTPVIFIQDLDLVEKVLIKDFQHFSEHGMYLDEKRNPLHANLFSLNGIRWKAVRTKLSPIFTSGKLRSMYETMSACGDQLIEQIDKIIDKVDVNLKEVINCFVMDTAGSCAFGIDVGNLSKPNTEFRRFGNDVLKMDLLVMLRMIILFNSQKLTKLFNITFIKPHIVKYFAKIIKETINYRRENNLVRNDFVQMIIQLQDKGYIEMKTLDSSDDYLEIDTTTYATEKIELTEEQLTGHAVTFLTAGFDPTSNTLMFLMYELAANQNIQDKVREEIQREVNNEKSLTYNALKEMNYLEQCLKETLRKYPPAQMVLRICTKEYELPKNFIIQPGQRVLVSVKTIHYDPKYYPEPEIFRPERFNPDNGLPSCAFIPFGNGPRICIGMRFVMLEMKFCIAKILMNYKLELSLKTKQPIELGARNFITTPKSDILLNITKLKV